MAAILKDLAVWATGFFRDPEFYTLLRDKVIPYLELFLQFEYGMPAVPAEKKPIHLQCFWMKPEFLENRDCMERM